MTTAPIVIQRTKLDLRILAALEVMIAAGQIVEVRVVKTGIPAIYEIIADPGLARAAAAEIETLHLPGVAVMAPLDGIASMGESTTRLVYRRDA